MTTFTFAQLETLWLNAGGSKVLAPLAAGIAIVESSGNPEAHNPSGASGLWQIEVPLHDGIIPGGAGNVFSPAANAKAAVTLSGNTLAGLTSNWLVDEPAGAAEAVVKKNHGTLPGKLPSGNQPSGGNQQAQLTSFLSSGSGGVLSDAGGLLHGAAVVIDRIFGMFAPGQGWRFVFGLAALVLALLGAKAFMGGGAVLPV